MRPLKTATIFIAWIVISTPCLAFTYPQAPVGSKSPARFHDPDAALAQTSSNLQDSYISNSLASLGGPNLPSVFPSAPTSPLNASGDITTQMDIKPAGLTPSTEPVNVVPKSSSAFNR